jgi:hypothetical protein
MLHLAANTKGGSCGGGSAAGALDVDRWKGANSVGGRCGTGGSPWRPLPSATAWLQRKHSLLACFAVSLAQEVETTCGCRQQTVSGGDAHTASRLQLKIQRTASVADAVSLAEALSCRLRPTDE